MTVVVAAGLTLTQHFAPLERLVVTIAVGAAIYTFFLLFMDRKLTTEFKTIAVELLAPSTPRASFRA
jgi:hypothetical protein